MVQFFGFAIFGRKVIADKKITATCPECRWRQTHASNSAGWCSGGSECRWSRDPSPGHRRSFRPCHEMDIFFEGLNILISTLTFCVCADGLQGLSRSFHYSIQLLIFISWNYLNLKMLQNSLFFDWSMFSSADLSLAAGKMRKNKLGCYRRLSVSIFSVKIAALGSLERVTRRIFKISKEFHSSKLKL